MKSRNHVKQTSLARCRADEKETWYFVRLAFLAVPWELRANKNPIGTLFRRYHLIQAKSMRSAFNKATHILSMSEHCDGDGFLQGKRVAFKKVGILDLEPLYERLESGVELFDESEMGIRYSKICKQVVNSRNRAQMIALEMKMGKPELLNVCWGKRFEAD
jgi:hypothetical protein